MHQKDLRWKFHLLGKIRAFRENECAKGSHWGENRAFVGNQFAEGTLVKLGILGRKWGFLEK